MTKLLHAVLLLWKFLANANSVYDLCLIGFRADDPATNGTDRSLSLNVIDAWKLGGLSNHITRRVKSVIKRSAQPLEQNLGQAFVKNKAVIHKKS